VDSTTMSAMNTSTGILFGNQPGESDAYIRLDQGLDTTQLSPTNPIDSDLKETQYIIEMDNRFGILANDLGIQADVSFVDDDNIASYFVSQGATAAKFITELPTTVGENAPGYQVIAGPRGTKLIFKIKSSVDLVSSTFLFTQLGSTMELPTGAGGSNEDYYTIDTTIKVTGATTGYRIDVPVRYIKKVL